MRKIVNRSMGKLYEGSAPIYDVGGCNWKYRTDGNPLKSGYKRVRMISRCTEKEGHVGVHRFNIAMYSNET